MQPRYAELSYAECRGFDANLGKGSNLIKRLLFNFQLCPASPSEAPRRRRRFRCKTIPEISREFLRSDSTHFLGDGPTFHQNWSTATDPLSAKKNRRFHRFSLKKCILWIISKIFLLSANFV